MRIGILDARRAPTETRRRTVETLRRRDVDVVEFHPSEVHYIVRNGEAHAHAQGWTIDQDFDLCLIRSTRGYVEPSIDLVRFLESRHIPCVDPSPAYSSPLRKTWTLTQSVGAIAVPQSAILETPDGLADLQWDVFPCFIKPLAGAQGRGVATAADPKELAEVCDGLARDGEAIIIQELLKIQMEYRVTVIGGEAIGVYAKQWVDDETGTPEAIRRRNFVRTSRPDLHQPAIEAARRNSCLVCGVDLAETDEDIYLLESNRCPTLTEADDAQDVIDQLAAFLMARADAGGPIRL